jgi:glycine cleavage system H protein
MGSVESVKSSSEIYSPVNGEVIEANEQLSDTPQLINEDPMGDGWLAKVQTEGKLEDYADLLTEEQYRENLKAEDH